MKWKAGKGSMGATPRSADARLCILDCVDLHTVTSLKVTWCMGVSVVWAELEIQGGSAPSGQVSAIPVKFFLPCFFFQKWTNCP